MTLLAGDFLRVVLIIVLAISAAIFGACVAEWRKRPAPSQPQNNVDGVAADALIPDVIGAYDVAGEAVKPQLTRLLGKLAVASIPTNVGDAFNSDIHEAVATVATIDPAQHHAIAEVIRPGWVREHRIIRPVQVSVWAQTL